MKLIWLLVISLFTINSVSAQKAPAKPAAKKTGTKPKPKKSTKKKTSATGEFDELICYEDGPCTFNIHKGDTLVYDVNMAGRQSTLFITPLKFTEGSLIDFNWSMSGTEPKSGHVSILTSGIKSSRRYLTYLSAGELKLSDASFLWLCDDNFSDITKTQKTQISFDGNEAETFSSPAADAVTSTINYKGKQIDLDGLAIQTKNEGQPDRKEMWVLNITSNLLIFKLDLGKTSMMLKEVREKKSGK